MSSRRPSVLHRPSIFVVALLVFASGCGEPRDVGVARARAHVDALAGRIGSRPTGSAGNVQAREYVASVLQEYGFAVRLQEADAVDARSGVTARVVNIIAVKDGEASDAIALVSHYDSVPDGPGAADDALGVATCLESARMLAQQTLRHGLFVIVTDGEEAGLMGARAVIADAEVARRVRAYLNFDGTGAAGPALLFESGPGWGAPLTSWASAAPRPAGASFAVEIYKRLPNDTDFTILKQIDASGLNFAPAGDSYGYHTDRDIASRVDPDVLSQEISNTVATVRSLDAQPWQSAPDAPVFFDLSGRLAVLYSRSVDAVVVWLAAASGGVAWILAAVGTCRVRRLAGLLVTIVWAAVSGAAMLGAGLGAVWLLRITRAQLNPWYASPQWLFLFVIAAGATAWWVAARASRAVSPSLRPVREPIAVWSIVLPVWTSCDVLLHAVAPAAAYLFAWPLLLAAAAVVTGRRRTLVLRLGSAGVLIGAALLWARNVWILLRFLVPLFGWLPVVAPVWLYPAAIAIAAVVIVPPMASLLAGVSTRAVTSRGLGLALVLATCATGLRAWMAPAYTATHPERRSVRFVQDDVAHRAWWEVAGNEPALDLGEPGPAGAAWQRADGPPATTVPVGRLGAAFSFRTPSAAVAQPPADAAARVSHPSADQTVVDVEIVPHGPVAVRLTLPPGLQPSRSSVAGVVVAGAWRATYIAPPAAGLLIHLEFDRADVNLDEATLTWSSPGVPGAIGRDWPGWLPRERAAWHATTVVIQPVPRIR